MSRKLEIPLYICCPNGILNPRFAASWKIKLSESGHLINNEKTTKKEEGRAATLTHKKDDEEYEEDEQKFV